VNGGVRRRSVGAMGSGSRARSRGFKPRDNFAIEESHRVSGSPPGDVSSVRRMDAAPMMPGSSVKCHACSAALSDARPVHLSTGHASDASAVGVESRAFADAAACRACGRGGVASTSTTPPSSSPPSPLAKSAEYLLERYAERRAVSLGVEPRRGAGGGGYAVSESDAGECVSPKHPAPSPGADRGGRSSHRRSSETGDDTKKEKGRDAACDACVACGDTCGVAGCAICGGTSTSADADVELAERGGGDGASAAAAEAAAEAAALAAANPRRDGWGRDGASDSAMGFTMDDLSTLTRVGGSKEKTKTLKEKTFSCCEVLRRRKRGRALLVAHGVVYDATLFLADHPVGPLPILRGLARDNTEDMQMHSAAAQRAWGKLKIGVLRKCPNRAFGPFVSPKGKYEACVVS